MKEKILTTGELKKRIDRLKEEGKTVVFTNGCFDILHVGHVRYLEEAKKLGDVLVLGLNSDSSVRAIKGPRRPVVPEEDRACVMAALESIDFVTLFDEETPLHLIETLEPHIIVKGGDWSLERIVGRDLVESRGGRVVVIPEIPGSSTTNIIEKILNTRDDGQ
ncbi:MAG: D-glycero-beta-D-manno-heptose 1-phosphate adenylyltransferase [Deltaproteobacteria bacterium]|nr:D-glycero-beta-D-manno-heptose 1-phosphate adenylyltransferase [Deltaproteobacteria bacterium]